MREIKYVLWVNGARSGLSLNPCRCTSSYLRRIRALAEGFGRLKKCHASGHKRVNESWRIFSTTGYTRADGCIRWREMKKDFKGGNCEATVIRASPAVRSRRKGS